MILSNLKSLRKRWYRFFLSISAGLSAVFGFPIYLGMVDVYKTITCRGPITASFPEKASIWYTMWLHAGTIVVMVVWVYMVLDPIMDRFIVCAPVYDPIVHKVKRRHIGLAAIAITALVVFTDHVLHEEIIEHLSRLGFALFPLFFVTAVTTYAWLRGAEARRPWAAVNGAIFGALSAAMAYYLVWLLGPEHEHTLGEYRIHALKSIFPMLQWGITGYFGGIAADRHLKPLSSISVLVVSVLLTCVFKLAITIYSTEFIMPGTVETVPEFFNFFGIVYAWFSPGMCNPEELGLAAKFMLLLSCFVFVVVMWGGWLLLAVSSDTFLNVRRHIGKTEASLPAKLRE